MDLHLLTDIDCKINNNQLLNDLRIKTAQKSIQNRVIELVTEAQSIAKPKGLYKVAYIEDKGKDYLIIDGIKFTSRILRINMEDTFEVFPYIATCGQEIENWSNSFNSMLDKYLADIVKEQALHAAIQAIEKSIKNNFVTGKISSMNPGSLEDWPINEQQNLFKLLGSVEDIISIELKENFLMVPIKTVSGIYFPTHSDFKNCQLCTRENCPGRRAPFDEEQSKKYI